MLEFKPVDSSPGKTSWRLVLESRGQSREAMEEFARRYWPPVFAHVRRKTLDRERALDLTQEFFARWIEKGWMERADPSRGRFRTFLYVVLDRFLAGEHDRERAAKRGGDRTLVALTSEQAERLCASGASAPDPAKGFTQQWALAVIRDGLDGLRREDPDVFRLFARYYQVGGSGASATHAELAREFGLDETDVNNRLQKGRALFRRLLEGRVRESLENPDDLPSEIAELFGSLSS